MTSAEVKRGKYWPNRGAVLGDALVIVPPDPHAFEMAREAGACVSVVNFPPGRYGVNTRPMAASSGI